MTLYATKDQEQGRMTRDLNRRERAEAMAAYAQRIVRVEPYPPEVEALIAKAMTEHDFDTRLAALRFLEAAGRLDKGFRIGGKIANYDEAVKALMGKFDCTKKTALKHVREAAMVAQHPSYEPSIANWGGVRRGDGWPPETVAEDEGP